MAGTEPHDADRVLTDPASYGDRRLDCDLVMKGGITSGVVYPLAVAELARTYRFRNIGGTSAGAIAAAAAAAAQHRGGAGFAQLAGLPGRLGGELASLFRPQRRCRRLFRLIFAASKPSTTLSERVTRPFRLLASLLSFLASPTGLAVLVLFALPAVGVGIGVRGLIADRWWHGLVQLAFVAAVAVGLMSWSGGRRRRIGGLAAAVVGVLGIVLVTAAGGADGWTITAWLAICMVTLALAVAVAIVLHVFAVLPANDFGLVGGAAVGTDYRDGDVEPLSEWLHTLIQELAGLDRSEPLTFGQLAAGPSGDGSDGANLTLLTTCLTQGRTYYLPWDLELHDAEDRFYFDPAELRRSMPAAVVDHLEASDRKRADDDRDWLDLALAPLVRLPSPDRIPVVMATRMSLSFPVLISTVPLRAVDWTLASNREARRQWREWYRARTDLPAAPRPSVVPKAERCYFSDGGIISNFPVHLFDSMLPKHPTFAINLRGFHPDRYEFDDDAKPESEKIWRPRHNGSGYSEWWTRWDESGAGAVFGFVGALKNSIQNWSDNDQTRVPGYRDRVVHVSHGKKEGGLNLAMPPDRIARLGERGRVAAVELERAFAHPQPPDGVVTGWRNHKWVRLRSSLALLTGHVASIANTFDVHDPTGVERYRDLLSDGPESAPSYQATNLQRNALLDFLDGVAPADDTTPDGGVIGASRRLSAAISDRATVSPASGAPGPPPMLRIVPGHRHGPPPYPANVEGAT